MRRFATVFIAVMLGASSLIAQAPQAIAPVPPLPPPFSEWLAAVRDEAATRALIAQENRQYARRQLIWFRKEPNLQWFDGPGESPSTIAAVNRFLDDRLKEIA